MSKTIKAFDFRTIKMTKEDYKDKRGLPFNPHVEIVAYASILLKDIDQALRISGHLMTEDEIDHHIRELKEDLDAVGKRAKAALLKAQADTKAIVSKGRSN